MDSSNKILRYTLLAIRIVLGGIFIYAGWVKLREPWELFALAINSYKILPLGAVELVARTLPWFEVLLGLWLISGLWLRISAAISTVQMLIFLAAVTDAYAKGLQISCGCFSNSEPISWLTLLRDGSMLAAAVFLLVMAWRRKRPAPAETRQPVEAA